MSNVNTLMPPRKLPVLRTLWRALQLVWMHRQLITRLTLPAFVLLSAAVALGESKMAGLKPEQVAEMVKNIPSSYWLPWMAASMAGTILLLMFSVGWRRFLLLDEVPSVVTFGKPFRRYLVLFVIAYFGLTFGVLVLSSLMDVIIQLAGFVSQGAMALAGAFSLLASAMVAAGLVARFALVFTAAVIDNQDMRLRDAAHLMRGNAWRYVALWIVALLGVNCASLSVMGIATLLGVNPAGTLGLVLMGMLTAGQMIMTAALTASVGALTYDFLVHGGGPDSQSEAYGA